MPKSSTTQTAYNFEDLIGTIADYETQYKKDITSKQYFGFPMAAVTDAEARLLSTETPSTAYFSMEFGIAPSIYNSFTLSRPMNPKNQFFSHDVFSNYWLCDYLFKIKTDKLLDIPIYGGGLGVLAGDTMKSAADLGYSVVAIGVLWNKGYFKQKFWYKHGQIPEELMWDPFTYPGLVPLNQKVSIDTREGPLHLRLWKYYIYSYDKRFTCPLILLDSNLPENSEHFRKLTDQLYRADHAWWKIFQRSILGIGGMKALKLLGYQINCFHLNEGHAAFALLEKYIELADKQEMEQFRKKCVFTCHTPVAAGHDRFSLNDVRSIFTQAYIDAADKFGKEDPKSDMINLTYLSLTNCHKVNAVAQKHGEVMRIQFPNFAQKIDAITNGVHTHTWVSASFQALFDQYKKVFGDWRREPKNLANVENLRQDQEFRQNLFNAHLSNKGQMIQLMKNWRLKNEVFTLGWARRIAGYKRPGLIFHNIDRLVQLAEKFGKLQIILAGKAHPNDDIGSAHIDEILDHIDQLNKYKEIIKVLILENYDTYFGKLLTNSVDVWLNNPLPPFEASGTSGMKAIVNGVLQVSTLDGWVVEAAEHDIGWIFGYRHEGTNLGKETDLKLDEDANALCDTLQEVVELYYQTHKGGQVNAASPWVDKMINCIKQSAFFNTQRMVEEYNNKLWGFPRPTR